MASKPRRRWFRFSLKMLFAVMTLVAIWLVWQASIVHERQSLISEGGARGIWTGKLIGVWDTDEKSLSWSIRTAMGDRKHRLILLTDEYSLEEFERFKRAFPESLVIHKPINTYVHKKPPGDKYRYDNLSNDAGTDE